MTKTKPEWRDEDGRTETWWDGYNAAHREVLTAFLQSSFKKLRLSPGDILVVRVPTNLSCSQMIEMRKIVNSQISSEVKAVVISMGVDLALLPPGTKFMFDDDDDTSG